MSNKEEKKSILTDVANIKKELMLMRIKASSGDAIALKEYRNKKKDIARLLTKYNDNK
jgi:ribosomal protein L29